MGILFPNMHDTSIPELIGHRTMASVPFAGRYRMIDFCLSAMANAGIQNIGVIVRQNYQSLMDHLGNGREWDLSRKLGGLVIFPPYSRDTLSKLYNGRIEALHSVMEYLLHRREDLVVMSDCNIACNIDYTCLLDAHLQSGADVTVLYEKAEIRDGIKNDNVTFRLDEEGFVAGVRVNDYMPGEQNLSMSTYVIGRDLLIDIVRDAIVRGFTSFETDVLMRGLERIRLHAHEFTGYRARIFDMQSYCEENMRLLKPENIEALFPEDRPVYTKVRDEAPVRFGIGSQVTNCLVADGCIVDGELENCVIFRGVRIGKGAKLKNCIIMQGSDIRPGAQMEYVVTDKNVTVGEGQALRGAKNFPVFVAKGYSVT